MRADCLAPVHQILVVAQSKVRASPHVMLCTACAASDVGDQPGAERGGDGAHLPRTPGVPARRGERGLQGAAGGGAAFYFSYLSHKIEKSSLKFGSAALIGFGHVPVSVLFSGRRSAV